MQLLLEAEVRQLTLGALQQFNLDVEECERKMHYHPVFHVFLCPFVCQDPSQGCAVSGAKWLGLAELAGAVWEDIWQYLQHRSSSANSKRSKLCCCFSSQVLY